MGLGRSSGIRITPDNMTRPIHKEHILQVRVRLFVRDAVDARHEFLGFDRSQASARFSHDRERAKGMRKGTADTLLMVLGMPDVWAELKRFGEKPEKGGDQEVFGEDVTAVGRFWFWADTVEGYRQGLIRCDVPLRANSAYLAMYYDGIVESVIAKAEMTRGVVPKAARSRKTPLRFAAKGKRAGRMQMVLP